MKSNIILFLPQHHAICRFPSKVFYLRQLITDQSVKQKTTKRHLRSFWPQGEDLPMVFCDIVGKEEEVHTGMKGTAKVGLQSKYNPAEARKIVSKINTHIRQTNV